MQEYKARRQRLLAAVDDDAVILVPAATTQARNADSDFPFRQASDFYYLTGFDEPDALLVLCPKGKSGEFILFNRPYDEHTAIWEGNCVGQQGAQDLFGADAAYPIDEVDEVLPEILAGRRVIYYPFSSSLWLADWLDAYYLEHRHKGRSGELIPHSNVNLDSVLHELRLIKTPEEISHIRTAVDVSVLAMQNAMRKCRPGLFEYQLEAQLVHDYMNAGCRFTAYTPIVAAGANACVLHYIQNNAAIQDGDLVLIDAGAEYGYYAADLTRTFPANGKFTSAQQAIYEIVLAAQLAGLEQMQPGKPWSAVQEAIVKVITQGLVDLNLLQGSVNELIESKAYTKYYMHNSGHWMGLDVHDAGSYKSQGAWRELAPNMVLTVEPGIYINPSMDVDEKWRGIGIRIEDDVLITSQGHEQLSAALPKTVEDVQKLMASAHD